MVVSKSISVWFCLPGDTDIPRFISKDIIIVIIPRLAISAARYGLDTLHESWDHITLHDT